MNHRMASPRSALDPWCAPPTGWRSPSSSSPPSPYARRASPSSSSSIPPASIARSSAARPPSGLGTRSLRRSPPLPLSSSSSSLPLLFLPPRTRAVDDAFDGWTPHVSNTRSPVANCSSSRAAIDSSLGTSSLLTSFPTSMTEPEVLSPEVPSPEVPSLNEVPSPPSRGNFMCASHLRSGNDLARDTCRHSPVFASTLYIGRRRHA
mmetsp:Transcript_6015/g.23129  ORF Transcript_6015/g.23129 Transcript_6015/m.23129 type:complete len:206 (-) Transcript_6015:372-989(-)